MFQNIVISSCSIEKEFLFVNWYRVAEKCYVTVTLFDIVERCVLNKNVGMLKMCHPKNSGHK